MRTSIDILKDITGVDKGFKGYAASEYLTFGTKLVRVSNHLPKRHNIEENNEGITDLLLFVTDVCEVEFERFCEELADELGINVEGCVTEVESEYNYVYEKMMFNNFVSE